MAIAEKNSAASFLSSPEKARFVKDLPKPDFGDLAILGGPAWPRLERVTRVELATSSLARRRSTTELHPQFEGGNNVYSVQKRNP